MFYPLHHLPQGKLRCAAVLVGVLLTCAIANAQITLAILPATQSVQQGTQVSFGVYISGLGNGTALGTYDFNLSFDSTVLSYSGTTFGDQLNILGLGDIQMVTPQAGTVEVVEVSLDNPATLDSLQESSFLLTTITLNTVGVGPNSLVTLSVNALGDAYGNPLAAAVQSAAVTVTPSQCAVTNDEAAGIADIQFLVNEALGLGSAMNDLDGDGVVDVVDIQIVIDATLGLGCYATNTATPSVSVNLPIHVAPVPVAPRARAVPSTVAGNQFFRHGIDETMPCGPESSAYISVANQMVGQSDDNAERDNSDLVMIIATGPDIPSGATYSIQFARPIPASYRGVVLPLSGNGAWVDTGVTVSSGDTLAFSVPGWITSAGDEAVSGDRAPADAYVHLRLSGFAGNETALFEVGAETMSHTETAGRLYAVISVNDGAVNSGDFTVFLSIGRSK